MGNVYLKLIQARAKFLEANISKSGKNFGLAYKYFELSDIIPTATKIFLDLGLVAVTSFSDTEATMTIYNTEKPEDFIEFKSPMKYAPVNKGTTDIQALGSTQTYLRRYLYLNALDICENDEVDSGTVKSPLESAQPTNSLNSAVNLPTVEKPAESAKTAEKREEIKAELTSGAADELQVNAIRAEVGTLVDLSPTDDTKAYLTQLSVETDGFTKMSRQRADEILTELKNKVSDILPF